ncbi:MAG: 1-deoxy-D-xylulose-5-phosphate reductoisomerase [Oscillospiraceae bacterium]|nr:1-deoxy-D-xylulose-5-phosphate reductoisomerase [Oscillospiraceae bacterium]
MIKSLSILGSTGSIGTQGISACLDLGIRVAALAAGRDIKKLEAQARQLSPELVSVYDEAAGKALKIALADTNTKVIYGPGSLTEAAVTESADCVLAAVSGSVGLEPSLAAISEKKRIALANKETLVCAGEIVMESARKNGAEIIPVDSEHSAIFQSLGCRLGSPEIEQILLTASGGPFRGMSFEETYKKTPAEALKHPSWSMGAKITIDSATMMNKGLEFIEAMHLFGVSPEQIEVLIHPGSVVHSAVRLCDGSVIAQMASPDMELPIRLALTYPDRKPFPAVTPLDLFSLPDLHFERPDSEATPCLGLAMDSAKKGGTAPCCMSAANEEAVHSFLRGEIPFGGIYETVAEVTEKHSFIKNPTLEELKETDKSAREDTLALIKKNR